MEIKDNPSKDNDSFEILTAIDSFVDKFEDQEIIPLAHSSYEVFNMISSALVQNITEETVPNVFDFSENSTDPGCNTNMEDNSDDDFIKIRPIQQDGIVLQPDDDIIKIKNNCVEDCKVSRNSPLKGIPRGIHPEIESVKLDEFDGDFSDSFSEQLSNFCHERMERMQSEVKNRIENHKTYVNEMSDVNVLPTSSKNLTRKRSFHEKLIYPSVLLTGNSENEERFKAQRNISAKKIYSFDSLEVVQVTSLNDEDLNADAVKELLNKTEDLFPEVDENFNEERFAVNTVLNGLGKNIRKCRPVQARNGREIKTTSSTIAFRRNSSRGICEAMFNSVTFCKWITKHNLMERIIDTAKAPIEYLLNTFEDQLNSILETPRKITVIEYLEVGGASISEAVTKGLSKNMGHYKFETAFYGSEEKILFHPLVGYEAGEDEVRKRIQMVRASGAVKPDGIIVAPVMVVFEDDEGRWQMVTLLYLEDPTRPRVTFHALTSSEPVDMKVPASWYMRHDCRRLSAITEAAEFLGRLYAGIKLSTKRA